MVYDIEAERRSLAVSGHEDDGESRYLKLADWQ
jgi:hypothetical protein